jgi:hypothetical protein
MDNQHNFYCTSSYARLEFLIQTSDTFQDLFKNAKNNLKCEKLHDYKVTDIKTYPQPEVIPFLNQKYFEMHITVPTEAQTDPNNSNKKPVRPAQSNKVNKIVLYIFAFKDDHLQHMHNFFKNYTAEATNKNIDELAMYVNASPLQNEMAQSKSPSGLAQKAFNDKLDTDADGTLNEISKNLEFLLKKLKELESGEESARLGYENLPAIASTAVQPETQPIEPTKEAAKDTESIPDDIVYPDAEGEGPGPDADDKFVAGWLYEGIKNKACNEYIEKHTSAGDTPVKSGKKKTGS